ncbi:MAG: glycosyltransferase family 2 protein, partial [Bryobacterales bacterium]|nr:glycosyltransferase family 2 protein [Bryobacterales bacterium]
MELLASLSFAVSCAGVFYTVAGYPLLLGWLAKRFGKPVHKAYVPRSVSVIIAVHNGQAWLGDKLRSVLELEYPRELMEILVVSDGSTDGTDAVASGFAGQGVRLIRVPKGGKPAALNAGIAQARGEILLLTDVRQTLAPESLQRLVSCFADPAVGVVSGDLLIRQRGNYEEESVGLYWRYERWIRKQLGSLDSMFGASGALYAMRRALARPIPSDTLLDDMYLPLGAFFQGYRLIVEENA